MRQNNRSNLTRLRQTTNTTKVKTYNYKRNCKLSALNLIRILGAQGYFVIRNARAKCYPTWPGVLTFNCEVTMNNQPWQVVKWNPISFNPWVIVALTWRTVTAYTYSSRSIPESHSLRILSFNAWSSLVVSTARYGKWAAAWHKNCGCNSCFLWATDVTSKLFLWNVESLQARHRRINNS